jgi:hypothetical protein
MSGNADESASKRQTLGKLTLPLRVVWQQVPSSIRKTLVFAVGVTIVLLGVALVVLPGPFTLPLLLLGFLILGTEFAWAATVLTKTRHHMEKAGTYVKSKIKKSK